jgi:B12-binding domain/radical SAM domain protein
MQLIPSRKIRFLFRQTEANRFTLPVLIHRLEKEGLDRRFEIRIIRTKTELKQAYVETGPTILAYSFMTPHIANVWDEIRLLKMKGRKNSLWIAGGPHPTGDPDSALRMGFDAVAVGEGERMLPKVCRDFLEKDDAPFPLDESSPVSESGDIVPPLEITRGCFFRCRFCQTGSEKPRHRSLESVQEYLNVLKRRNLLFRVGFICPSGFEYGADRPGRVDLERIEMLLRRAKETGVRYVEYGVFPSEVRPETVTPESLSVIKSWCSNKKITLGGQTGSESLMRKIRRGHTRGQIDQAAAYIREAGLKPQIDIILGFPEETFEDRIETLTWMKELHTRYCILIHVHYFLPLAGTPYADADPQPLEPKIEAVLDEYHKAGICNDWWRKGKVMSQKLVSAREELRRD